MSQSSDRESLHDQPTVTWQSYALVVAGALTYTCLLFTWFSLPAYLPTIIAEVGLTGTEAGVLVGAVPLTYIPLALFTGLAVDRIGPTRSLAAGVVVFGLAQVARSFAGGFPTLLATTLLLGVGATAITFGLPKLVSVLFPPDRTGLPSSIYLVGASAGTASVFAIGRPVIGPALGGWRPLFLWSGVVAVGYAGGWLLAVRLASVETRASTEGPAFTPGSLGADLRAVLFHPQLRLVVVVGTMYLLVSHGMQGWLPTVLESRGLSATLAGRATSLLVAANVVGVLTIPTLSDRLDTRRGAVMACGLVVAGGLLAVIAGGAGLLTGAGIVAVGLGIGGISPLVRAIPAELDGIGPELTGAAVGLIFAVGEIGGFLGPVLLGSLRDVTGSFVPGLAVLAGGALLVVGAGGAMAQVRG